MKLEVKNGRKRLKEFVTMLILYRICWQNASSLKHLEAFEFDDLASFLKCIVDIFAVLDVQIYLSIRFWQSLGLILQSTFNVCEGLALE